MPWLTEVLQRLTEEEAQMNAADRLIVETAERKNALESYVYDMRNKLNESLAEFAAEQVEATCSVCCRAHFLPRRSSSSSALPSWFRSGCTGRARRPPRASTRRSSTSCEPLANLSPAAATNTRTATTLCLHCEPPLTPTACLPRQM